MNYELHDIVGPKFLHIARSLRVVSSSVLRAVMVGSNIALRFDSDNAFRVDDDNALRDVNNIILRVDYTPVLRVNSKNASKVDCEAHYWLFSVQHLVFLAPGTIAQPYLCLSRATTLFHQSLYFFLENIHTVLHQLGNRQEFLPLLHHLLPRINQLLVDIDLTNPMLHAFLKQVSIKSIRPMQHNLHLAIDCFPHFLQSVEF